MLPVLPLAAGANWIEAILPILVVLFWIVVKIRDLVRWLVGEQAVKPRVQRPVVRRPEADDAQRELMRQIEQFVRGSKDERVAPRRSGPPPVPRGRTQRPTPAPAGQGTVPIGSLGGHAGDVDRHVREAFAQELQHLPAGLSQPAVAAAQAPAGDVATLLRNPVTLRQLVLVREVLDRPIDRW